jgi:virulence plasmid B protein
MPVMSVLVGFAKSSAVAARLPLPVYDASKVANPSATVPAGEPQTEVTSGVFPVSETGTAHYEIPLEAVPGRGGFQPTLSISYSSRSGDGQLGVGFGLSGLSHVSRCAKTMADDGVAEGVRLSDGDRFCLNGLKLVAISGVYGAHNTEHRTVPDTHVRVKPYRADGTPAGVVGPTHFVVWTPGGDIQDYGTDGNAVEIRNAEMSVNLSWPIVRAQDRPGNVITYAYSKRTVAGSGEVERWLDAVSYGHGNKLDRRVSFAYEDRPDKIFGWRYGAKFEILRRLKAATMSKYTQAG